MKWKRILLKLSGESLMAKDGYSIDYENIIHFSEEIRDAVEHEVQVGVVIGGGNIFRGVKGAGAGFDRRAGDYMGMLATVINAVALENSLSSLGVKGRVLTAMNIEGIGEKIHFQKASDYLNRGEVVIFGGGTGNPFFTTDSAAALRAAEIHADLFLKGTRVDGVYTADPEKDPSASRFEEISFEDAYNKGLKIMDLTAFTICKENHLKLYVYNANQRGNLLSVLQEKKIGTLLY
ncbi:MAG: UMP kinase [Bacteroidales bacterium]|jgi:uridylate kinase|nr:UMP kinase [Bacteroidales bacterium]